MLTIPKHWRNATERNDACTRYNVGAGLIVWVDHECEDMRESHGLRFAVARDSGDTGENNETLFESDDFDAILAFIAANKGV